MEDELKVAIDQAFQNLDGQLTAMQDVLQREPQRVVITAVYHPAQNLPDGDYRYAKWVATATATIRLVVTGESGRF